MRDTVYIIGVTMNKIGKYLDSIKCLSDEMLRQALKECGLALQHRAKNDGLSALHPRSECFISKRAGQDSHNQCENAFAIAGTAPHKPGQP